MRSAANFKVNTLQVLFAQVLNIHLKMNTSLNLECLTLRARSSKLVYLGGKNLTCFIQNLVGNLMKLVLSSKSDRKRPKNG